MLLTCVNPTLTFQKIANLHRHHHVGREPDHRGPTSVIDRDLLRIHHQFLSLPRKQSPYSDQRCHEGAQLEKDYGNRQGTVSENV